MRWNKTVVVRVEWSQAELRLLHAFDADALERLTGQPVQAGDFGLRQAQEGEPFTGLDERELRLDNRAQVVTCHGYPIAMARL